MNSKKIHWFIPRSLLRRWKQVNSRLSSLELAVDTILGDSAYAANESLGFNGQRFREQIFRDVMSLKPTAIVECGTFLGNTTGFMAEETGLPVYTSEIDRRVYLLAKMRLKKLSGIHFHHCDSRSMLKALSETSLKDELVFFYLDAHWLDDLPLQDELRIIANHWGRFVIMVDDFEVEGDPGYGFDDYGAGKRLDLSLLRPILIDEELVAFSPTGNSATETGLKRGSIIVAPGGEMGRALSQFDSLRLVCGKVGS